MNDKASYVCDSCGEETVVPVETLASSLATVHRGRALEKGL